jgi:hypothetical protein
MNNETDLTNEEALNNEESNTLEAALGNDESNTSEAALENDEANTSEEALENDEANSSESEEISEAEKSGFTLESVWKDELKDEIEEATFLHSKSTMRKGQAFDPVVFLCGCFALVCMIYVTYNGIHNGFTTTMKALDICYLVVAFACFCVPLQCKLSRALWNIGLKKKFPINEGAEEEISLDDECLTYKNAKGSQVVTAFDDMDAIYETENLIVFQINDKSIILIDKNKAKEDGIKDSLYDILMKNQPELETSEKAVSETISALIQAENAAKKTESGDY